MFSYKSSRREPKAPPPGGAAAPGPSGARRARPKPRRARGEAAIRERILAGAERTFAMRGVEATPVEDILRAAQVSRPTFYKFFQDKDQVLATLVEKHNHALLQMVGGAAASPAGPLKKLERGIEAFLHWRVVTGAFARVMEAEARKPGGTAAARRRDVSKAFAALAAAEVRKAGRAEVDPLIYVGLLAALEAVGASVLRSEWDIPGETARAKRVMARLVRAALAEGKDPIPPLPRLKRGESPYPKKPARS